MQKPTFPTEYEAIKSRMQSFDPTESYQDTRNQLTGDVSYLSPYITHGVLPLRRVFGYYFKRYDLYDAYKFLQELTWREFFQRVWWNHGDEIFEDMRRQQPDYSHTKMPTAVLNANTGIDVIDQQISQLYSHGYVHNHARMWIASLVCNICKTHWWVPSLWFHYHLLDGDPASNMLNWQWVAGSFSYNKYWFNQENINKHAPKNQEDTWLDTSYANIKSGDIELPQRFNDRSEPSLAPTLPDSDDIELDTGKPLLLYYPFHLDPQWRADMDANRVLVLEPPHFQKLPVSEKVMEFILELADNISGMQVYVGEVDALPGMKDIDSIYTKAHPAFDHFPGQHDSRDIIFRSVADDDVGVVFTPYWKDHCYPRLKELSDK